MARGVDVDAGRPEPAEPGRSAPTPGPELLYDSDLKRWLTFGAAIFPATLYVGTQTVANAVLPQMQGDLSAGLDQISWVITASVVAAAIGIPPTAWLTARFGRRRLMMTGMCLFAFASVMVGLSESLGGVIFWRMFGALCAAPMTALSQAITLDVFPEEKRALAFAAWAIGILSGWAFAPALGAYISELHSWRLIFFLVAPVALLGALTVSTTPETQRNPSLKFDWFGFFALSIGLGSLLLVLNRGQRMDWFNSPEVVGFTALGVLALYIFAVHTATSSRPFIDWRVFRNRNYTIGLLIVSTYAGLSLAPLVLLPAMLEQLRGLELLTTGLVLIPRGLAQMVGLIVVGIVANRMDPRILVVGGFLVFAYASFEMAGFNLDVGMADVMWPNVVQGFAMAFIWVPLANQIYAGLDARLRTDATTFLSLIYSLSSSIGVSVSVTLLTRSTQVAHEELAGRVDPYNDAFRYGDWSTQWDLDTAGGLARLGSEVGEQAMMIGFVNVFWATAVFALCVLPFTFFVRRGA